MNRYLFPFLSLLFGLLLFSLLGVSPSGNVLAQTGINLDSLEQITGENVASLEELLVFEREDSSYAGALAFSSNGDLFAFSLGGTLNLWEIAQEEYLLQVPCCSEHLAFSPDSQYLATSGDYLLYRWNVADSQDWIRIETGTRSDRIDYIRATDIKYSENGEEIIVTHLATGGIARWSNDGELLDRIDYGYGPDVPTVQGSLLNHYGELNILSLSGIPGGTLEIRDVSPNAVLAEVDFAHLLESELSQHPNLIYHVDLLAVSPANDILVNIPLNAENGVLAWVSPDGVVSNSRSHNLGLLSTADFPGTRSEDGIIAVGSYQTGEIYFLNSDTGYQYGVLQAHTDGIVDLAFNPRRNLLASSSQDGSVRLWGIPSGQ